MQERVRTSYLVSEFIQVFPMFSNEQCKQMIELYDKDLYQATSATPIGDKVVKNHRDCKIKIVKENKLLDDFLDEAINMYRTRFPFVPAVKKIDSQFLKYDVNGRFNTHVDHYAGAARTLSLSVILNDEYMGGQFQFWSDQGDLLVKEVQPVTGDVLIFPSNFLFPHSVAPITFGTRYAIVNWYN